MNRLYLVRHGENPANITKEFSSRYVDYSLTPKGILQAQQTAEYFVDKRIDAVYASPLKRARETAEIIGARLGLPVAVMDNFREVDVGELESRPPTRENWAAHNAIVECWMRGQPEAEFPGGDHYVRLWSRMRAGVERIAAGGDGRNLVVVAHGGIFTFTLKDLCHNVDVDWLFGQQNHNCSITEILVDHRDGRLEGELVDWASCAHLHGAAALLVPGIPEFEDEPA